jgi:predicted metal-dependent hydrolase
LLKDVRYQPVVRELVNGESFLYLGRNYRLSISLNEKLRKPVISLTNGVFLIESPSLESEYLRKYLVRWYKLKASIRIKQRIEYFAPKVGVTPTAVRIKEQEKRWGSCTNDGILYFNWRGVLAPAMVLDYIVAHELCHLKEKDHSNRFWGLLRAVMPDYEMRKQWLMENGVKIDI